MLRCRWKHVDDDPVSWALLMLAYCRFSIGIERYRARNERPQRVAFESVVWDSDGLVDCARCLMMLEANMLGIRMSLC